MSISVDAERLEKLEQFYRRVAELTVNHDVLKDSAVVYPSKLGEALETVDREWWKTSSPPSSS